MNNDWLSRRRATRIEQAAARHVRASEALATERAAAEVAEATAKLPRWEVVLIRFRASIPEPIRMLGRGLLCIVNFLVAIAEKGGKIAVLVLAALFLLPSLYGTAVRWMPHSYYLVGALGQPPGFDDLPAWNIDLPAVDAGASLQRRERLIASLHAVVRLRGEDKYIPGHTNPYEGAASPAGKEWERNSCLFVDNVVFVTRQRFAQQKRTGKGPSTALEVTDQPYPFKVGNKPAPELRAITASALLDETPDHLPASAAALLKTKLKAGGVPQQCQSDMPGEVCPRIQIWLYGVPAACNTGPPKI